MALNNNFKCKYLTPLHFKDAVMCDVVNYHH